MRMPAFVALSMGIVITQAPEAPPVQVVTPNVGPVMNLHIEALRSIIDGATRDFEAEWPSRAPQAFEYNGATYHYLPCDTGVSAGALAPSHRINAPELLRRPRVSPHSAPDGPGS
jgi:hypothetical protein